jgi:hypothetical protein
VWARGLGGGGLSVGGVDLERVDAPERIGEGTRVVGNVIVAAAELAADGVGGKDVAGPVTTEGGVKNERHVAERGAPVAAGSGPCRIGGVPSGRVGRVAKHVGRDGSPREEPDVDGSASPFGGVHAAVVGVEARTIAVGRTGPEATAGVAVYRGVTVLAEKTATGTIGRGDGATRGGVKGHLVGGVGVDTFDDVDLSTRRPVWAHHPASQASTPHADSGGRHTYKAGQVPQPSGICSRSITTRALLYVAVLVNRMLVLPPGVGDVLESTPIHGTPPDSDVRPAAAPS